ncbi:MAG: hypothetical protein M3520_04325 [Actinomycetota bacterium]|nr:hypothetical protein [Actinomycetota bacterium]
MSRSGWGIRALVGPRAIRVWWWVLIIGVALNGVVVGYGAIWFQLFGEAADRSDYLVSAGGYAAAAGVLVFAAVGVAGLRGPKAAGWTALMLGVALALAALTSLSRATELPVERAHSGPLDGVGAVLLVPLACPMLVAGVRGGYRLVSSRR